MKRTCAPSVVLSRNLIHVVSSQWSIACRITSLSKSADYSVLNLHPTVHMHLYNYGHFHQVPMPQPLSIKYGHFWPGASFHRTTGTMQYTNLVCTSLALMRPHLSMYPLSSLRWYFIPHKVFNTWLTYHRRQR